MCQMAYSASRTALAIVSISTTLAHAIGVQTHAVSYGIYADPYKHRRLLRPTACASLANSYGFVSLANSFGYMFYLVLRMHHALPCKPYKVINVVYAIPLNFVVCRGTYLIAWLQHAVLVCTWRQSLASCANHTIRCRCCNRPHRSRRRVVEAVELSS